MIKNYIISVIMLFSFGGGAFAVSAAEKKAVSNEPEQSSFCFQMPGGIPAYEGPVETHFLGDSVAVRWSAFQSAYIRSVDLSVGFSGSDVTISKPAVFNSVEKINRHLRKKIKRQEISEQDAATLLMHILNCSLVIASEPETNTFEEALLKAKSPENMIGVYAKVNLIY